MAVSYKRLSVIKTPRHLLSWKRMENFALDRFLTGHEKHEVNAVLRLVILSHDLMPVIIRLCR